MHRSLAAPFAIACLGIFFFSCMDVVMKGQSIAVGAYAALLWRSAIGAGAAGLLFAGTRRRWPGAAALRLHAMRGLLATGSVLLFFWGLARTPMAVGLSLTFLSPLIATFLAALTLGERVRRDAIWGSLLAFAGVGVVVAGRLGETRAPEALAGAAAIFAASFLYAGSLVALRRQAQAADPVEITFLSNLVALAALASAAPFAGVVPVAGNLALLAVAAALAILSSMLLAWAYARGEAQAIAPVEYTSFVWAALFGALVFGEALRVATVAGAALIVGGCLLATRRARVVPAPQTEAAL